MAFAAAVSLLQILKQLQLSDISFNILYPKSQIQLLYERVHFLKYFLKENSEFESRIRDTIYEAEDIVESFLSSQFLSSEDETLIFSQQLQRVIEVLTDFIAQGTENFGENDYLQIDTYLPKEDLKNRFFGRYEDMTKLMDQLTGSASRLEVVAVVGIPGIGKTTLAQHVYNDLFLVNHFDIRAWVTLSPEYQKRDVLLEILRSMKKLSDEMHHETDDQLAKHVNKCLNHKRYLVVLDDVCDIEVWKVFKQLFTDDNKGSRVMLTTENMKVAGFAVTNGSPYELGPLDEEVSWGLLCEIVFGNESSPLEHGEITKDIAVNCEGLPLAIVTIGRLLSWTSITEWQRVASSINNSRNHVELMEAVVSLCYQYLPQNLKACFLYLGIFPYSYEIPVSKLIKLWIAEGFLEFTLLESLEEIAKHYLSQLINMNLVSVCERRFNGGVKTCKISQVFHDFIIRKAEQEKFVHVINKNTKGFLEDIDHTQRRLCIHKNVSFGIKDASKYNLKASVSSARSVLFVGTQDQHSLRMWLDFKRLRVLDALKIRFYSFPSQILKLVHLKYLALRYNGELPASVCKLLNLQFLIVLRYLSMKHCETPLYLPMEIWNMNELRHLQFFGNDLPDPSTAAGENDDEWDNHLILENLLTLTDVSAHSCTAQILARIPNLKKLGILIGSSSSRDADEPFSFFNHLDILAQLESLKCIVIHPDLRSQVNTPFSRSLPSTLKKVTLSGCGLAWEHMTIIGSLPNLEVLKLRNYAFQGPEWTTNEGEFCRLSFLLLEDMDVVHWMTDSSHFPSLRYLIIRHCYNLEEIPSEIGEIPTLERIELVDCSPSAMQSALGIKEEQLDLGNEDLEVNLHSSWDD